ncbi:hypothetical protein SAMN02745671_00651 [Anaerovibrio lipolyticus DSM 3074]|uniref:Uncharacterized protein n=1 Tax=Anaerovibrio lipolyticus DSM 3074 TaxID=1120997 RepID=A0A1M6B7F2_9FIRM|nr:hypothetical protein [Anaerovibrio lipolyticus]SHI44652.1 hypothetical protein SAMN02745671_00651 [Anaerovibrio lipolyticus DSM 3074]
MDNLIKLQSKVNEIIKEANKKPVNVGALRGTMTSSDTVLINGVTYRAVLGTQVNVYNGVQVWVQLTKDNTAVIIGA